LKDQEAVITSTTIDATVFYKHEPAEIEALSVATIPLAEQIRAASAHFERQALRRILAGEYFRAGHAAAMRAMLLRACKYARGHLTDYFPLMRDGIIADVERLEEATEAYWVTFQKLASQSVPTP
jgi:hypothetical protein